REAAGIQAVSLRLACGGKYFADVIEGLDVCNGVGARRAADRALIHEHRIRDPFRARFDTAGAFRWLTPVHRATKRFIKALMHQRGLAGSGHSGDARCQSNGNLDIDVLEVVPGRAFKTDGLGSRLSAFFWWRDA